MSSHVCMWTRNWTTAHLTVAVVGTFTALNDWTTTWKHARHHTLKRSKGQHPFHQFPRSKSVTSWRLHRCVTKKSIISPQRKRQACNKLARAKVHHVTLLAKFHYNDLLPTSLQLPHLWGNYGETCLMDFGHYYTKRVMMIIKKKRYHIML